MGTIIVNTLLRKAFMKVVYGRVPDIKVRCVSCFTNMKQLFQGCGTMPWLWQRHNNAMATSYSNAMATTTCHISDKVVS